MFERFTPAAREAVVLAQQESHRLRHSWLGTEHLLLALLGQQDTRAIAVLSTVGVTKASVERSLVDELGGPSEVIGFSDEEEAALRSLGLDLTEVRRRVEEAFGRGALDQARPGQCGQPMMPRLKKCFERARRRAGAGLVDTDDLLAGLTEVPGALALNILESLGVDARSLRATIEAQRRQAS
jgi:ATP-dependent Clp protease ATP-binding subunit ClpA